MNSESTAGQRQLVERVTQLEELITHLQQTVQDLNAVALEQSRRLDRFELGISQMKSLYGELTASPGVERDPGLEKPPHY